jgi:hypothetical protein
MQMVCAVDALDDSPNEIFTDTGGAGTSLGPAAGNNVMADEALNDGSGCFIFFNARFCKDVKRHDKHTPALALRAGATCCRMARNSVRRSERMQKSWGMQAGCSAMHLAQLLDGWQHFQKENNSGTKNFKRHHSSSP